MIAVALGPPSGILPERRQPVTHDLAPWPGPKCNQGVDPAVRLITGQLVDAERVTCWRCRTGGAG